MQNTHAHAQAAQKHIAYSYMNITPYCLPYLKSSYFIVLHNNIAKCVSQISQQQNQNTLIHCSCILIVANDCVPKQSSEDDDCYIMVKLKDYKL